jgi:hypothetical protein
VQDMRFLLILTSRLPVSSLSIGFHETSVIIFLCRLPLPKPDTLGPYSVRLERAYGLVFGAYGLVFGGEFIPGLVLLCVPSV